MNAPLCYPENEHLCVLCAFAVQIFIAFGECQFMITTLKIA